MARSVSRNTSVETAVEQILAKVDAFIDGEKLSRLPSADSRRTLDQQLTHKSNSVRLASLFLVAYSSVDKDWDCNSIPTGIRGQYGDKRLAEELTKRGITLHNSITAFGENLGWKGNVSSARLQGDARFNDLSLSLASLSADQRVLALDYMAARFAETRRVTPPLPPVGDDVLTYVRARELFYQLIAVPSEGNIQQFLVAALLAVHRERHGYEIRTHHVHASDRFDTTAGDIEELYQGDLLRAYEVTVRPDWKNRVSDFKSKMDRFGLKKYAIIASNVKADEELAEPAQMIRFLRPYGRDIAVVDIRDFCDVFAMELSATDLRKAVNRAYEYLTAPKLCGRTDIIERFSDAVGRWLDNANSN
ncbi:MAG: hypothetical protein AAFQ22_11820 [Pseudomonadota bacterium]